MNSSGIVHHRICYVHWEIRLHCVQKLADTWNHKGKLVPLYTFITLFTGQNWCLAKLQYSSLWHRIFFSRMYFLQITFTNVLNNFFFFFNFHQVITYPETFHLLYYWLFLCVHVLLACSLLLLSFLADVLPSPCWYYYKLSDELYLLSSASLLQATSSTKRPGWPPNLNMGTITS